MDLEFSADQRAFSDTINHIVSKHMELPRTGPTVKAVEYAYADRLDRELENGEFFSVALAEGMGAVEAASLIYETCKTPQVLEVAGSGFVAPLLTGRLLPRPVAIAREQNLGRAVRFLDRAKTLIVDCGNDVAIVDMAGIETKSLQSNLAYPLARVEQPIDFTDAELLGPSAVPALTRLWQTALAMEAAAAMEAAVNFTAQYVKDRKVFARPLGSFQAVQHRLSVDVQKSKGAYWLALKAAWSANPAEAALAALYAQQAATSVIYDCHQFNGALGMTLEHALHFWTFRLRLLQSELGGPAHQAADAARQVWSNTD